MVRIAPVRLVFNPKTLWFDAGMLELPVGCDVVVQTSRGLEFGTVVQQVFDASEEDTKKLNSPLKPVKRIASDEDRAKTDELAEKSIAALPTFKRMAAETVPDMNPVAVEFLFEGEKAVFYFESEDRLDFRDLVRKLAAEFHVRVDMKQIGVRDEARMVGGLGHCGQELCCRRLGGEFNPVSIRMAKEQDLSLNPQKISGVCGRLMCCLRYEYDAYKDFHSRAPKKNAKITTPEGEGKVVDLDVPREIVSIKVGDEKPVKVPLAAMDAAEEGARPTSVGAQAWEAAHEPAALEGIDAALLFGNNTALTGDDALADPSRVHHVHEEESAPSSKRRRRRSSAKEPAQAQDSAADTTRKPRRRRSVTVGADGETSQVEAAASQATGQKDQAAQANQPEKKASRRRRRGAKKTDAAQAPKQAEAQNAKPASQVGRKSSALRARHEKADAASRAENANETQAQAKNNGQHRRPRRRSRRSGENAGQNTGGSAQAE